MASAMNASTGKSTEASDLGFAHDPPADVLRRRVAENTVGKDDAHAPRSQGFDPFDDSRSDNKEGSPESHATLENAGELRKPPSPSGFSNDGASSEVLEDVLFGDRDI
ncbi:MAG: hypothetical protein Q9Q13_05980 [Acidobacteriota bacterium]|nr:hypothetical protein [Acidobacteriota bacterium]